VRILEYLGVFPEFSGADPCDLLFFPKFTENPLFLLTFLQKGCILNIAYFYVPRKEEDK